MNRLLKYSMILMLLTLAGYAENSAAAKTAKPQQQPAQAQESRQTPPPAVEVADATYDFGEMFEDSEVTHDFTLRNTGKGELVVDRVQTS